jgi:hypothetical protein
MELTFTPISELPVASKNKQEDLFLASIYGGLSLDPNSYGVDPKAISSSIASIIKKHTPPKLTMVDGSPNDGEGTYRANNREIVICRPETSIVTLGIPRIMRNYSRDFAYFIQNTSSGRKEIKIDPFGEKMAEFWGKDPYAIDPMRANENIILRFREIDNHLFMVTKKTILLN